MTENNMSIGNENINYETRVVAFIDILGFKEIIKESLKNPIKLKLINDALKFLKGNEKSEKWDLKFIEIEETAQYKGVENFKIADKISVSCFSDSIVISVLVDNNINEMTSTLVANISKLGASLMMKEVFIRGAITIGELIHTENGIIMGPALIEAYELESKFAKYPRIILSEKLLKHLNYPVTRKANAYPYHQYISRFEDGSAGFHQMIFFQVVTVFEHKKLKMYLKAIKNAIIKGLDSNMEHLDIFQKYLWLKNEYAKLIIFPDKLKEKIYEINEGIKEGNIHYSYTDNFYYPKSK